MKISRLYFISHCVFWGTLLLMGSRPSVAQSKAATPVRIVSTDGTLSEILCSLGLEKQLVGVDVTSTYPASLQKLPKVGHNRSISAEGILSLNPDLIVANSQGMMKPEILDQLKSTGKKVVVFEQKYTAEGTKALIREVGRYFGRSPQAEQLIKKMEADLAKLQKQTASKKVLFIYARGAGTLMVSGMGTSVDQLIRLSGHQNAAQGFTDFKPLTSEALLAANPDVLLLFSSGLESLGGVDGLLKVPGIAYTNAGKNRKVITMDGQLMTGFGPRLGQAAAELSAKAR
ncbi:hemin ABC transporter substrate-binding protein [Rhabdobacter roseus]|uniref:Iron complex transport system substrate-binding protein n=1 Tax=Rhabdobacter roseus TaxID=1655419 RepID=A0A840TGQ4_9BACT|nr:ABC transporter substrate-binding protein [Rhabdobacter roseus]MBB5282135.1 iron complex transport system substrate-binding protein [Rhabdobacter roseus]